MLVMLCVFFDIEKNKPNTTMEEISKKEIEEDIKNLYTTEELSEMTEKKSNPENVSKKNEVNNKEIDFSSKTLIINSNKELEIKNAQNVIRYDNYTFVKYETEELTEQEYNKYKNMDEVKTIEVDQIVFTEEDIEENAEDQKENTEQEIVEEQSRLGEYIKANSELTKQITVAVLDTGIDLTQQNILARIKDSKANYATSGYAQSIMDDNGHGTKVASVIINNTEDPIKVLPIKVANSEGKATITSTYFGIKTAIENNADIINISLSTLGTEKSEILEETIK